MNFFVLIIGGAYGDKCSVMIQDVPENGMSGPRQREYLTYDGNYQQEYQLFIISPNFLSSNFDQRETSALSELLTSGHAT